MKKAIFLLCLGSALGLASCSQEELIDAVDSSISDGAISFHARSFKPTRADELTTDNLREFSVYAYKGDVDDFQETLQAGNTTAEWIQWFEGPVQFKRTDNTFEGYDLFKSDKLYYYPTDNTPLTFFAYAPSSVEGILPTDKGELVINAFTVKENIVEQVDLITDVTPAYKIDGDGDGVRLYFQHALSKVYVSGAWNSNEEYTYQVAGIKLGNIAKTGKYIFNKYGREADFRDDEEVIPHEWTPATDLGDIIYIFDDPVTVGTSNTPLMSGGILDDGTVDKKGAFMMIPQQLVNETASTEESPDGGNISKLIFKDGVAYVALLIRITHNKTGDLIYPYAKGTDNVSETVNGIKYAWAAFPVASKWEIGKYVDYVVDFSKGAGFIPGGAEGYDFLINPDDPESGVRVDLEYKPILGTEIRFMEEVSDWNSGKEITLDHIYEGVVDVTDFDDPFFE